MRVAIKFCGGCDPTFDRVEFANQVKRTAGEHFTWIGLDQDSKDAVLVICGCQRACPIEEIQDISISVVVTSAELSPEIVVDRILRKGKNNEN